MEKINVKLVLIVLGIVLAIGLMAIFLEGFNYDLTYSKNQRIEVYLNSDYELADIVVIANNIYGNKRVLVQKVGAFEEIIAITVVGSTDEQIEDLVTAINEKYSLELTKDESVLVFYNSNVRMRDVISPYILPNILVIIAVLVFAGIRYKKIGIVKVISIILITTIMACFLYLVALALVGPPISITTIQVAIAIQIFALVYIIYSCEKQLV